MRGLGADAVENGVIQACIEAAQRAQAEASEHINVAERGARAAKAAPRQRQAEPAKPAPAFKPAPAAEAPRVGWPAITSSKHPRVQECIELVQQRHMEAEEVRVPADATDGEWVDFCLANMTTVYPIIAAKFLQREGPGWADMSDSERRQAVAAKAAEIEAYDAEHEDDTYLDRMANGVRI